MKAAVKKVAIGVAGGLVLLVGIVMIVLPGPAFLIIPAGFAILATEFKWAHDFKEKFKQRFQDFRVKQRSKKRKPAEAPNGS